MAVRWLWTFVDTLETHAATSDAFWAAVTRTTISPSWGPRGEFATLVPGSGDAWVMVQAVGEGGGVHPDLAVEGSVDDAAGVARRLGATEVEGYDEVTVMRSPGGLPFCIASWRRGGSPTHQVRDRAPDLLDQICIDVPSDLYAAELGFWEQLTGWSRRAGSLPEFTLLTRPDGIPVRLLFQRLGEAEGAVRAHLDFACHDRAVTREVHVAAGATVVSEHDLWTVMRDPVGRIYCLTSRRP